MGTFILDLLYSCCKLERCFGVYIFVPTITIYKQYGPNLSQFSRFKLILRYLMCYSYLFVYMFVIIFKCFVKLYSSRNGVPNMLLNLRVQ